MPAIINVAGNLILGAGIAWVARRSPAQRESPLAWPLLFLLGFEAVVVTPVATYLFRFYPQWSMLYWFDPQMFTELDRWVGWLSLVAILLNFVAASSGYVIARFGLNLGYSWLFGAPLALGGAAIIAVFWTFGDRVVFVGDYDAFWTGQADFLLMRLSGWVGLLTWLGGFLFVLWLHTRFKDHDPTLL